MINHNILKPLFIPNLNVNSWSNNIHLTKSGLAPLCDKSLQWSMIWKDINLRAQQVLSKLVQIKTNSYQIVFIGVIIQLSIIQSLTIIINHMRHSINTLIQNNTNSIMRTSHIISKGKFQLGDLIMGAEVNSDFNFSKQHNHHQRQMELPYQEDYKKAKKFYRNL